MNVNTNTEVTLYDFLNYEVVGVLLLFICGFTPCDTIYEWLFFVFAFIAGLVFSKLAENAFWTKWTRNPNWAINKGMVLFNENIGYKKYDCDNYTKQDYYKDYYRITKEPIYKTIQILEAQYRFMENLFLLSFIFLLIVAVMQADLDNVIKMQLFDNLYEKQKMVIYIFVVLFLCVCMGLLVNKCMPDIDCCIEKDFKKCIIGVSWIITIVILIAFLSSSYHSKSPSICYISLFAMLLFCFLAYKIQLKISTLVIEGAYYSNIIDNQKEKKLIN